MKRLRPLLARRRTVPAEGTRGVARPGRETARGQAFALLAIMSSVLFAFAGLGINTSADEATQMKAQAASDAAGVSAARQWASDITTYGYTGAPIFQNTSGCTLVLPAICPVDASHPPTGGGVEPAVLEAGQITQLDNLTSIILTNACVFSNGTGSGGSLHVAFYGETMTSTTCSSSYASTSSISPFQRVDIYIPPQNPPSLCSSASWRCIEVDVAQNTSQVFGNSLGTTSVQESASSVVYQPPSTTVTALPCGLCVLGSSGTNISLGGGATVTVNNASIYTNSTATPAIQTQGSTIVQSTGSNAGIDIASGGTLSCGGVCIPGTATPSATIPDPYANVPAPSVGGAPQSFSCSSNGSYDLYPGVYSSFKATGNCTITLEPGVYVFESSMNIGGTTSITDPIPKVSTNSGVMLYFTCSGYSTTNTTPCNHSQASDTNCNSWGLNITGTHASLNLTPPSSGIYQGMGVFYDRTLNGSMCLSGGVAPSLGTVYAYSGTLNVTGNAGTESAIVVNNLSMGGSSSLGIDGSVNGGAAPMNNGTVSTSSYAQIAG